MYYQHFRYENPHALTYKIQCIFSIFATGPASLAPNMSKKVYFQSFRYGVPPA